MNRINRAESDLVAEKVRLDAVIANCQKMLDLKKKRVEWLTAMYQTSAAQIAESLLPRKADGSYRSKTYTCPWGQVAFRDVKPKVVVENQQLAVAWAKEHAPDAVKVVESVLVSKLPQSFIERWVEREYAEDSIAFSVEPGRQSVTVKTVATE